LAAKDPATRKTDSQIGDGDRRVSNYAGARGEVDFINDTGRPKQHGGRGYLQSVIFSGSRCLAKFELDNWNCRIGGDTDLPITDVMLIKGSFYASVNDGSAGDVDQYQRYLFFNITGRVELNRSVKAMLTMISR